MARPVPVDDAPDVLRRAMWQETDKQYRAASEGLIKINTSKEVQVQTAEEHAPDFSREKPHTFLRPGSFRPSRTANPGKKKFACTRARFARRRRF